MKKTILIFILMMFSIPLVSKINIERIIYNPNLETFNDIKLFDKNFGIAVGNEGVIKLIYDEFKKTKVIRLEDHSNILCINFFSESIWITVGENGTIFRSSDSGVNWIKVNSPTTKNLNSVITISDSLGIIIGDNGIILRSLDFGLNWEIIKSGENENFNSISKSNNNNIFIVGNSGTAVKSLDLGMSWTKISTNVNINFHYVESPGSNLYLIGDSSKVLLSKDNGESLKQLNIDPDFSDIGTNYEFVASHFLNQDTGFFLLKTSNYNYEYTTHNGGKVWNRKKYFGSISCSDFVNHEFGIALESLGMEYIVNFKSWFLNYSEVPNNIRRVPLEQIEAKSPNNLYISYSNDYRNGIIFSNDMGKNWEYIQKLDTIGQWRGRIKIVNFTVNDNVINIALNSLRDSSYILDGKTQYTTIKNGFVLYSQDNFKTWNEFEIPTNDEIRNLSMCDKNNGVIQLNSKNYLITSDGGINWQFQNFPDTSYYIFQILYPEVNHLIFVNHKTNTEIWETFDGGINWKSSITLPENCDNIYRSKDSRLFAYGTYQDDLMQCTSFLYEYDYFAKKWNFKFQYFEPYYSVIQKIISLENGKKIIVTSSNILYETYDNWQNFSKIDIYELSENKISSIKDIAYINNDNFYIIDHYYNLFSLNTNLTSINEMFFENHFNITPNPAGDYITIQFQTSEVFETSEVSKVQIFDMLGLEVGQSSLIDDKNRIDISYLPTGIYFIKIGDKVEKFVKM